MRGVSPPFPTCLMTWFLGKASRTLALQIRIKLCMTAGIKWIFKKYVSTEGRMPAQRAVCQRRGLYVSTEGCMPAQRAVCQRRGLYASAEGCMSAQRAVCQHRGLYVSTEGCMPATSPLDAPSSHKRYAKTESAHLQHQCHYLHPDDRVMAV
jgi:hypothetical protein